MFQLKTVNHRIINHSVMHIRVCCVNNSAAISIGISVAWYNYVYTYKNTPSFSSFCVQISCILKRISCANLYFCSSKCQSAEWTAFLVQEMTILLFTALIQKTWKGEPRNSYTLYQLSYWSRRQFLLIKFDHYTTARIQNLWLFTALLVCVS